MQQAQERFGSIDVLVNNAGYGYRAAVEEGDDADVRTLFETNFFGTVAMIKAVLPGMRARRSGAIVNISSIGVQLTPAGSGYYSAAKAAIEGMSGALRDELAPLGISVTVVEPGAFRTDFAGRSLMQSATVIDDYAATAGRRRKENDTMHRNRPATQGRPAQLSSRPSNQASRPHSCSSDPTPSPPTATSPTGARTRSRSGNTSRPAPTSTPSDAAPGARRTRPHRRVHYVGHFCSCVPVVEHNDHSGGADGLGQPRLQRGPIPSSAAAAFADLKGYAVEPICLADVGPGLAGPEIAAEFSDAALRASCLSVRRRGVGEVVGA